jgi:hypothetical protein
MLLDGSEESPTNKTGRGIKEFIKLSKEEGGLLLPAQAALVLDVSRVRVFQLMDAGLLASWDFFGRRYLSGEQLQSRRAEDVKAGRPKMSLARRVVGTAKSLSHTNGAQMIAAAVE